MMRKTKTPRYDGRFGGKIEKPWRGEESNCVIEKGFIFYILRSTLQHSSWTTSACPAQACQYASSVRGELKSAIRSVLDFVNDLLGLPLQFSSRIWMETPAYLSWTPEWLVRGWRESVVVVSGYHHIGHSGLEPQARPDRNGHYCAATLW